MDFLKVAQKIFGSKNDRDVKRMRPLVARIGELEPKMQALKDEDFPAKIAEYKQRHENGESLDKLLPECFALVREASIRTTGMRHFDVQMIGGITLHQGKIAEMKTGEGKTLVATLPMSLNAIAGKGTHLVTVNDYLAKRDAEWMSKIYHFLGYSVGVITHDLNKNKRQENYRRDITYGTNNEFGFDYLRDNMEFSLDDYVQRDPFYAIIDEVDSILVDEARTPLIISGPKEEDSTMYLRVDAIMPKLQKGRHFTVEEKSRSALLTDEGVERVESLLGVKNLFEPNNILLLHHVNQALLAHAVYKKDVDYLVQQGQVMIIDEFTGRALPGRRWSDGLHQSVEAKEKVKIESESETLATISFQNYFRLYDKLAGMTGTAETEAAEFHKTYKMEVLVIPTNKPIARLDHEDVVYRTEREKFEAVIEEIKEYHKRGQPVLVGTISIEKSEILHKMLTRMKIPHNVLNAKQHEKEAEIVVQAGRLGAVTIATNMAGRGTDIVLGGNPEPFMEGVLEEKDINPKSMEATIFIKEILRGNYERARELGKELGEFSENDYKRMIDRREEWWEENKKVKEAGGFHILGTERHDSRRIDNQLRGRAGRQGDPGSSRFFLSLEDDLMRRFGSDRLSGFMETLGMEYGEPIEHRMVSKAIENAQKKVEAHNFEIRKHMLDYDDVMNIQRKTIYQLRRELLGTDDVREKITEMMEDVLTFIVGTYCPPKTPVEQWDLDSVEDMIKKIYGYDFVIEEEDLYSSNDPREGLLDLLWEEVENLYEKREEKIGTERMRAIEKELFLYELDDQWKAHLTAIDHLREGINLQGYRQIDPKLVYKKEAYNMFQELLERIKANLLEKLFHIEIIEEDFDETQFMTRRTRKKPMRMHRGNVDGEEEALEEEKKPATIRRKKPKLSPNAPCWCGSGKKYKKCHMMEDLKNNA